jgi:hypothetical protein
LYHPYFLWYISCTSYIILNHPYFLWYISYTSYIIMNHPYFLWYISYTCYIILNHPYFLWYISYTSYIILNHPYFLWYISYTSYIRQSTGEGPKGSNITELPSLSPWWWIERAFSMASCHVYYGMSDREPLWVTCLENVTLPVRWRRLL